MSKILSVFKMPFAPYHLLIKMPLPLLKRDSTMLAAELVGAAQRDGLLVSQNQMQAVAKGRETLKDV